MSNPTGTFTIQAYGYTSEPIEVPGPELEDARAFAIQVTHALTKLGEEFIAAGGHAEQEQIFIEEVRKALEWAVTELEAQWKSGVAGGRFDMGTADTWLRQAKRLIENLDGLAVRESEIFRTILNRAIGVAQGFVDATSKWRDEATGGTSTTRGGGKTTAQMWWFERREGYIDVATLVKVWWLPEVGWVQLDLELGTFTPLNECEGRYSEPVRAPLRTKPDTDRQGIETEQ